MPDTDSANDMDAYLRMLQGEATNDQQRKDLERQAQEKHEREVAARRAAERAEEEKLEQLRIERANAEARKLAIEHAERDRQAKERQAAADAVRRDAEAERQRIEAESVRVEREHQAVADAARRESEAERQRIEAEKQRAEQERQASLQMERQKLQPIPFDKPGVYAARLNALGWVKAGKFRFVDQDFDGDRGLFQLPKNIEWADFILAEHRPQKGLVLKADHDEALQAYDSGAEHTLYAKLAPANKTFNVEEFSIQVAGKHHVLLDIARQAAAHEAAARNAALAREVAEREGKLARVATLNEIIAAMVNIPGESYAMCAYQVTQAWYQAISGANPSHFKGDPLRPVEHVSWHDAQAFCNQLNELSVMMELHQGRKFALPDEEMWRFACHAGSTGGFGKRSNPHGLSKADLGHLGLSLDCTVDEMAWHKENSGNTTHRVGEKEPNAWGLFDMHGNVWEFCDNEFEAVWEMVDGKEPTIAARGGSWSNDADRCTADARSGNPSNGRYANVGFRVALVPA